jgi:hypothetical protein
VDALIGEQLEAAGVHARQHRDRLACIVREHQGRCKVEAEVELAARHSLAVAAGAGGDVADLAEALGAQQILDGILWCYADAGDLAEPDRGDLRRAFVGQRLSSAEDACGASR